MHINTTNLEGIALDWAVANCQLKLNVTAHKGRLHFSVQEPTDASVYSPSTKWEHGGPILEKYITKIYKNVGLLYTAEIKQPANPSSAPLVYAAGPTMLIAAMRCYILCLRGKNIYIPDELLAEMNYQ